ncbi:MAG: amylo-alpha-1,6-glucosidase, partial [Bacteroidota bacterium]
SVTIRSNKKPVSVEILPLVTDGTQLKDFIIGHREHALVLARRTHTKRTPAENFPVWLAVSGTGFEADHEPQTIDGRFAPFSLRFGKSKALTIAFAVADESPIADSLIQSYLVSKMKHHGQRRQRMEKLLNDSWVETENKRFDKALCWAKLSLDALIMNQVTKGIFAGLPWFNNYWGRDTFISLPGATLVTGRFAEAKGILRSFARYQQTDTASEDYGRIPNIVTTTTKAYNTADGTPRFVMMAREYVERSGDSSFIDEIYDVIQRATDGTLTRHCDSLGFLTHADAETWMDAVGPEGPWSPRGNRANDIQALWAGQLESSICVPESAMTALLLSAGKERWRD